MRNLEKITKILEDELHHKDNVYEKELQKVIIQFR